MEAKKMGYTVGILDPSENAPAVQVADFALVADFADPAAVRALAERCDVVTYEFENVAAGPLRQEAATRTRLHPSPEVLHVAQNREREKSFLAMQGFPCARFFVVSNPEELARALAQIGGPCVLKTADFGYDGKGQMRLTPESDPARVWIDFGSPRGVLEAWVPFVAELSVIVARWENGTVISFPPAENYHRNHILDTTIAPGRFSAEVTRAATHLAEEIARALEVVGLLAVEMFLLSTGELLVNELAPRPHNSGHHTFDACPCGQFAQHVRAVCGLPAGSTQVWSPAVMTNLLGDLWTPAGPPPWTELLREPSLFLHLYGKNEPKAGRKMGHFTILAPTVEEALAKTAAARSLLSLPPLPARG